MDGAVVQLLGPVLAGRRTARAVANAHAHSIVNDAILAADELDMVIPGSAAGQGLAPALRQALLHQRPADAHARDDDGDAGLDGEPLERGHLGPGEVLRVDLQDGDEAADADADVEDAEAEDERQRDLVGARHLQLPGDGDGQRPDGQLDREAPCGDGGDDGDLGEAVPGLGDIPIFGKGDAAQGDDEDGEDDPEDVDDIAGED